MDETKQNPGDTSQTVADSSKGGDGITSTAETPKTFTKEQMEKAVSDALSKAGRLAKAITEQQQKVETEKAELRDAQVKWQKEKDEAEEYRLRDDPEELATLRAERKEKAAKEAKATELAERESKLAKRETEHADVFERDRILNRTQLASEVALEKGVDFNKILDGAKIANDYSRETMEKLAALLPPAKELPTLISDSGRTKRGGDTPAKAREKMLVGLANLHPEGK